MPPDLDKYLHYLDQLECSSEQKIEMMTVVWRIMENFVDRAFGSDPTQQALHVNHKTSGQSPAFGLGFKDQEDNI